LHLTIEYKCGRVADADNMMRARLEISVGFCGIPVLLPISATFFGILSFSDVFQLNKMGGNILQ
jgi:hypothetical protein